MATIGESEGGGERSRHVSCSPGTVQTFPRVTLRTGHDLVDLSLQQLYLSFIRCMCLFRGLSCDTPI